MSLRACSGRSSLRRQIVEQVGARLPLPGLGALAAGQLQAVEQEFAELARASRG